MLTKITDINGEKMEYFESRKFRQSKRQEIRYILKTADKLRTGSVYTPAYNQICEAIALLEESKYLMSIKKWKR